MIDMSRKWKTRSGLPVRILCVDAIGLASIVGLVNVGGFEVARTWSKEGNCNGPEEHNLIEDKPKLVVERFVNILQDKDDGSITLHDHRTKEDAETYVEAYWYGDDVKVLARAVPFKWEEGE